MRTSRFSEEQVLQILQEARAGTAVKVLCAKHNISPATFHAWKRKFGGMAVDEVRRLRALAEENARLKRLVADKELQIQILKEVNAKNGEPVGQAAGGPRQRARVRASGRGGLPRYGYRRITALLRRAGACVNPKRVQRIRAEGGLKVRKRQRKARRLGLSTSERQKVTHPDHVWSCDFVHDQTGSGAGFRIFTMVDEHTRECLALHAAWSLGSKDVIAVIAEVVARRGAPGHLRCDNGPEFISYAIRDWLETQAVGTLYIRPGSPWENPYIESFHDKLRDEFLNRELFDTLRGAQVALAGFRREYNTLCPHSALRYLTPAEFAAKRRAELRSAHVPASPSLANPNQNNQQPNQAPKALV